MMHVHGRQLSINTVSVIFQSCIFLSCDFSRPVPRSAYQSDYTIEVIRCVRTCLVELDLVDESRARG